ncbi:MAG: hypothetical protein ACPL07_00780, partial [Candidatus Bathyarchaeia archaeon]
GTYVVMVYWDYGGKSGVMEFSIVKDVESDRIYIPKERVNNVLDQIGRDEAQVLITKAELFDYRLFFPTEFLVNGKRIRINLFDNEMMIDGKRYRFKPSTDVWGGKIRIDAEFEGKNIVGKTLALSFYQDGEIGIKYGEHSHLIKKIEVDVMLDIVRIEYKEGMAEYSFDLKPLSEQMEEHPYEIMVEGRKSVGLREMLFRSLGYPAYRDLEEKMGIRYGIVVKYDNDEKAYCGTDRLAVNVPEGATKIESIKIVPIEERIQYSLHKIIENLGQGKPLEEVLNDIGYVGEHVLFNKYRDVLVLLVLQKAGASPDQFAELKDKIACEWLGARRPGEEVTDILIKANGEITLGRAIFHKDEVIAIVEIKSTIKTDDVIHFESKFNEAKGGLKKYISLKDYETAPYGVAVVFAFNPVDMIWDGTYPEKVGLYDNPYMKAFTRIEIERGG